MPDTLSSDALNDERLAADRRRRTAHLGPLPRSIAEVLAAAMGVVEVANQPEPDHEHGFEMAQDAGDAAYERLEEAVKALAAQPPVVATWHQGSGSRPSEDRSYVFDAEGRVVASLNYLHPEYEANAARIVGAGAPNPAKAQLLPAAKEILAIYREDSDEWNSGGRIIDAMMDLSVAIEEADGEVQS